MRAKKGTFSKQVLERLGMVDQGPLFPAPFFSVPRFYLYSRYRRGKPTRPVRPATVRGLGWMNRALFFNGFLAAGCSLVDLVLMTVHPRKVVVPYFMYTLNFVCAVAVMIYVSVMETKNPRRSDLRMYAFLFVVMAGMLTGNLLLRELHLINDKGTIGKNAKDIESQYLSASNMVIVCTNVFGLVGVIIQYRFVKEHLGWLVAVERNPRTRKAIERFNENMQGYNDANNAGRRQSFRLKTFRSRPSTEEQQPEQRPEKQPEQPESGDIEASTEGAVKPVMSRPKQTATGGSGGGWDQFGHGNHRFCLPRDSWSSKAMRAKAKTDPNCYKGFIPNPNSPIIKMPNIDALKVANANLPTIVVTPDESTPLNHGEDPSNAATAPQTINPPVFKGKGRAQPINMLPAEASSGAAIAREVENAGAIEGLTLKTENIDPNDGRTTLKDRLTASSNEPITSDDTQDGSGNKLLAIPSKGVISSKASLPGAVTYPSKPKATIPSEIEVDVPRLSVDAIISKLEAMEAAEPIDEDDEEAIGGVQGIKMALGMAEIDWEHIRKMTGVGMTLPSEDTISGEATFPVKETVPSDTPVAPSSGIENTAPKNGPVLLRDGSTAPHDKPMTSGDISGGPGNIRAVPTKAVFPGMPAVQMAVPSKATVPNMETVIHNPDAANMV